MISLVRFGDLGCVVGYSRDFLVALNKYLLKVCAAPLRYSLAAGADKQKRTPKKNPMEAYDNIPTEDLDITDPGQFIIVKSRFALVVQSDLASFNVSVYFVAARFKGFWRTM